MLAYLDCFSGISGDMLLGAMLDAGLSLGALRAGLGSLPLGGYSVEAERVTGHGISGTRALVHLDDSAAPQHRHLADIEHLLVGSWLPDAVRDRALSIFRLLAEAEAQVHGSSLADVTFHEVGAVDSIVDVVGAALGIELLGIEQIHCSELPLTSGRVRSAHGPLPVPAPATLALLKDTSVVWRAVPAQGELVTPTGAAVLAAVARFERPSMTVRTVGYGFGRRALPWANCLRLILGDPAPGITETTADAFERDEIVVLETNIDNMTGESLGWLMDRLLAAGALDVSFAPLQMKKNRPGALLTVLSRLADAEQLAGLVLRESATLGVRMRREHRLKAGRSEERIETPLGLARVKLKRVAGQIVAANPEYDDCRALAELHGLPLETVTARISAAARQHFGLDAE